VKVALQEGKKFLFFIAESAPLTVVFKIDGIHSFFSVFLDKEVHEDTAHQTGTFYDVRAHLPLGLAIDEQQPKIAL
jgi:hypothetical protein